MCFRLRRHFQTRHSSRGCVSLSLHCSLCFTCSGGLALAGGWRSSASDGRAPTSSPSPSWCGSSWRSGPFWEPAGSQLREGVVLEIDRGVRPDVRSEGRPEVRPRIGASGSDRDTNRCLPVRLERVSAVCSHCGASYKLRPRGGRASELCIQALRRPTPTGPTPDLRRSRRPLRTHRRHRPDLGIDPPHRLQGSRRLRRQHPPAACTSRTEPRQSRILQAPALPAAHSQPARRYPAGATPPAARPVPRPALPRPLPPPAEPPTAPARANVDVTETIRTLVISLITAAQRPP